MSYISKGTKVELKQAAGFSQDSSGHILAFHPHSQDMAFDDTLLDSVKEVWRKIVGDDLDNSEFMRFKERGEADEDDA